MYLYEYVLPAYTLRAREKLISRPRCVLSFSYARAHSDNAEEHYRDIASNCVGSVQEERKISKNFNLLRRAM